MNKPIQVYFQQALSFIYKNFLKPRATDEDSQRREFILNVLLTSLIVLLSLQTTIVVYSIYDLGGNFRGASLISILIPLSIFIVMYLLGRKGYSKHVAFIFVWTFFGFLVYAMSLWGVDVPQVWLFFALAIAFAAKLVNTRMSFVMTGAIAITFCVLIYLQEHGQLVFDRSWKDFPFRLTDAIGASITFLIFTIVSWLSNREIHKSLQRARNSEAMLKIERDSLEEKVVERTSELVRAQEARLAEVEHFAEFGQLASGIMHDLANPLTAISLNLQQEKEGSLHVREAVDAASRMEALLKTARKQFIRADDRVSFSIADEIDQAVLLLAHKATTAHVRIVTDDVENVHTYGIPIKLFRVVMNLVSNGIDAYTGSGVPQSEQVIRVSCTGGDGVARINIEDRGAGIPEAVIGKIFQPLFTTKNGIGSGFGLSVAKEIVEQDFGGSISVVTRMGEGTMFTVEIPIRES